MAFSKIMKKFHCYYLVFAMASVILILINNVVPCKGPKHNRSKFSKHKIKAASSSRTNNSTRISTNRQADLTPEEKFEKFFLSIFDPSTIGYTYYYNMEKILEDTYGFTRSQALTLLFDYDDDRDLKLTLNQFKDIIRKLFNINPLIVSKRINAFQKCDTDNVGFVAFIHIYNRYHELIKNLKELTDIDTINFIHEMIKKHGNGKGILNFLEFNCFADELFNDIE